MIRNQEIENPRFETWNSESVIKVRQAGCRIAASTVRNPESRIRNPKGKSSRGFRESTIRNQELGIRNRRETRERRIDGLESGIKNPKSESGVPKGISRIDGLESGIRNPELRLRARRRAAHPAPVSRLVIYYGNDIRTGRPERASHAG